MNDTISVAIIGAGATLLGVVVGSGNSWFQERVRAQHVHHNVRLLVQLENDRNLKALAEFWTKVEDEARFSHPGLGYGDEETVFIKRRNLVAMFLAPWGHLMWESHATQLAAALSRDEIERTYALHSALEVFNARRAEMQVAFSNARHEGSDLWPTYESWREQAESVFMQSSRPIPTSPCGESMVGFNQDTIAIWAACKEIVSHLDVQGNPVQEDTTPGRQRITHQIPERIARLMRRQSKQLGV